MARDVGAPRSMAAAAAAALFAAAVAAAVAVVVLAAAPATAAAVASGDGARGGTAKEEMVWIVVTRACYDKLVGPKPFSDFDLQCLAKTASKLLSFAIIAGSSILKVPQILAFLRSGSVAGVDKVAVYTDMLAYVLTVGYHLRAGSVFAAYGESAIISVQSAVIVLMMWAYDPPGTQHTSLVTTGYAVAIAVLYSLPSSLLYLLMGGSTVVTIISRTSQLLANIRQKGAGQLAFLTSPAFRPTPPPTTNECEAALTYYAQSVPSGTGRRYRADAAGWNVPWPPTRRTPLPLGKSGHDPASTLSSVSRRPPEAPPPAGAP